MDGRLEHVFSRGQTHSIVAADYSQDVSVLRCDARELLAVASTDVHFEHVVADSNMGPSVAHDLSADGSKLRVEARDMSFQRSGLFEIEVCSSHMGAVNVTASAVARLACELSGCFTIRRLISKVQTPW